ncbi:hypothetical protein [Micromonospora sp. NPDC004704]
MSFDAESPPLEPPADCRHRLLWRLARSLWEAHRPDSTGFCVVTGCQHDNQLHPCHLAQLAIEGMRTACGDRAEMSRPWIDLTRQRIASGEIDRTDAAAEIFWRYRRRATDR